MIRPSHRLILASLLLGGLAAVAAGQYPRPSPYPITWELGFEHAMPKRIVVPVDGRPQAFWYMTYTVSNDGDEVRSFLPKFDLLAADGQVFRGDQGIPASVFAAVKAREGNPLLEPFNIVAGDLRVGPEQARDGVVIWREPNPRMGSFYIFVEGLSGEAATIQAPAVSDVILRKTLQLGFSMRGDGVFPSDEQVVLDTSEWIMR